MRIGPAGAIVLLITTACVGATHVDETERPWTPGESLRPAPPTSPLSARRESAAEPRAPVRASGQEIVVAGRRVPIGTRVVLWSEPGGYNAYRGAGATGSFAPGRPDPFGGSDRVRDADGVERAVDELVLHYDACGLSRLCFDTLERRDLSVHFLLDLDGTLYQTLDLAETAWHARDANGRSVGVEIANIGAYPPGPSELDRWYGEDAKGTRVTIPRTHGDGGLRTAGFVARPARPYRARGYVHGVLLEQYDFTPEQYEALARLAAALVRTFPRLQFQVPVDLMGRLRTGALTADELRRFGGILGHQHLTTEKTDPGPAFDWERFVGRTRSLLERPGVAD
jgi:hypothetical protein